MQEKPVPGDDEKTTFTKDEVEALIAERNKAIELNRNEALKEAKAAKARLAAFEGIDPEEHKTLKAQAEEAARKKAAAEGDFKSIEEQLKALHATELGARDKTITKLRSALEQRLVDAEATRELAEAKGSAKVLLPHVKARVKVVESDDGAFSVQVVDERGNQRLADGQGTPMTLKQLVEELRADSEFARAFEGTGSSGGGASKSNAGGGGAKVIAAGDNKAFIANLDNIATGKATVV